MNKDLLEEYQNDENVKSCEECEHFGNVCCIDNDEVCDDYEWRVRDEN